MAVYVNLIVALLGVFVYFMSAHPKLQELGRLAYGAGLLAFLLQSATILGR